MSHKAWNIGLLQHLCSLVLRTQRREWCFFSDPQVDISFTIYILCIQLSLLSHACNPSFFSSSPEIFHASVKGAKRYHIHSTISLEDEIRKIDVIKVVLNFLGWLAFDFLLEFGRESVRLQPGPKDIKKYSLSGYHRTY